MFDSSIGLLLVAEMSTPNNLINYQYTYRTVDIALRYNNVIGFICQHRLHNDSFIYCSPGVNIGVKKDGSGQSYNSPHDLLVKRGMDYIIVGRGIYNSADPECEIQKYLKS
jgi:uridine monophosphate synthetase